MAVMSDDVQRIALDQLQSAPFGPHKSDGNVHDLLEQGFESSRPQESCTQIVYASEGRQVRFFEPPDRALMPSGIWVLGHHSPCWRLQ